MSDTPATNSYDAVPYDSLPFAQTHPSRLATVATLFGLTPPPPARCRVLELGCAAGGNLIPMAEALPESTFVGVDLSARQIDDGARVVRAAGLTNVSLRHASITDIDAGYGSFDYILCHGVFSWVPRAVQEKILTVCADHLAPNGVAYISYNTYPGWHMRGMIRDMMRYHALRFEDPVQRIGQARALLDFLAQTAKQDTGAYAVLLRSELEFMRDQSDHYIYHEQLEDVNEPVYFHQFVERATARGLSYLGEARVSTMVSGNFGADVQKTLALLAPDQIQTEQYLDFVRNRTFRETLLVRADQTPNWGIEPDRVRGLSFASGGKLVGRKLDLGSGSAAQFQSRTGMVVSASAPLFKAALLTLTEEWPGTVPFTDLLQRAVEKLSRAATAGDASALALGLLNAHIASDLVELHAVPVSFARVPGEAPVALVHARLRAADGHATVANRRHEVVKLADLSLHLLPLLDGTRDRAALTDALTERALAGQLTVQKGGHAMSEPTEVRAALAAALGPTLDALARDALLVN
ncbi:methyltransferase regulatory domain-containing protein [Frigoriglobus tundricola]|uniref:SAM-dependent methyltransferase n=1 Tax=Frigoriglobus tundricola TaxID=2774151 RepID=A0A6M5YTL7_9BACT|nr:class I SAM-dependent methyltransferase [Frigoriglobus tundricola]QJW97415.1 SAM-dependent methyltransferase [Frigoriglobus tundricola]